jgi:TRAP transporter TAXI family solute receptor
MRRSLLIGSISLGVLSVLLISISATMFYERPTTLRVALASSDIDDYELVNAAARLLKRNHGAVRLKIVGTDNATSASAAIDAHTADLAVVRTDLAMPVDGDTVVLLHKDVGLLVAPGGSEIGKVADLAGKTVGIVAEHAGDRGVLDAALNQYDLAPDAVKTVPLPPEEVTRAVKAKTVDAVFAVGLVSTGLVPAVVKAVAAAGEGPPVFVPVAEAPAIAQRSPAYESIEVVRGAFGGTPPRPAEEFDTLGVTTRLVASEKLDNGVVGALTRFLLSERTALAAAAPVARRMEAPSTDKGAPLPAHPGTAAYIDDDEETFLDRYSDVIYIGAMVLGVLASGATAIFSRLGASSAMQVEDLVSQLLAIFRAVRSAQSLATLDQFEDEVDDIVASALDPGCVRSLDDRRVAMLNLAVDQVRVAIHDRREALRRGDALEAEPILIGDAPGPTLKVVTQQPGGGH